MDRTAHAYRDHSVEITILAASNGWTWTYAIDQQPAHVHMKAPFPTPEMAFEDAVVDAEMVIDGLISTQYGGL
jgi:hypothetical protein